MEASTKYSGANQRAGQSGGDWEGNLHVAAGLRNQPLRMGLKSHQGELLDITAITLAQLTNASVGFQDVTGSFWNSSIANGGFLSIPSTLCLTLSMFEPTATGTRTYAWRVTGYDVFGNRIVEEMPAFTANNTNQILLTTQGFITVHRQWTSKCFAMVEKIEISKSAYTTTNQAALRDAISIGTCFKWDAADGWAILYHDGTGGDYTLDVTIGGVAQTTAPIADNATNDDVRAALEALANVTDVRVSTPTIAVAPTPVPQSAYIIEFLNPNLGKQALSVNTNSLTGGTQTIVITGEFHSGRENVGIACPREILAHGPVGRGNNLYPDVLNGHIIVPRLQPEAVTMDLTSTTDAGDLVTVDGILPYQVGEVFPVILNGVTGLTPDTDLVAIGTAITDDTFTVNVDISTTAGVGEVTFLVNRESSVFRLRPAPGERLVPTGAGWRCGISADGYAGDPNKLQLYLDGNAGYSLLNQAPPASQIPLRINHRSGQQYGPLHEVDLWVRNTTGSGRRPTDSTIYPR